MWVSGLALIYYYRPATQSDRYDYAVWSVYSTVSLSIIIEECPDLGMAYVMFFSRRPRRHGKTKLGYQLIWTKPYFISNDEEKPSCS